MTTYFGIADKAGARQPNAVLRGLLQGAALALLMLPAGMHVDSGPPDPAVVTDFDRPPMVRGRHADFGAQSPSPDVRHVADWIADSRDNGRAAFFVIDKKQARMYLFDPVGRLTASTPVLLGTAIGDDSVPGIGLRPVAAVRPAERTTPAGRFVGEPGHNTDGEDVVWVDYAAAVSMHRVRTAIPRERRLHRLATPTNTDNRITYGCINVPTAFYENHVRTTFTRQRAIVYVLPEVRSVQAVFGSYDVAAVHRSTAAR